jgi:DsrE/DsrF-like family
MSSSKIAIVVLSDPGGGDDALGRVFNALAATYDFKQKQHDVQLLFQGAGTRWTGVLTKADHPAHALYKAIEDKVAGASLACSVVFGAREAAQANGFSLIADNPVPGTEGLPSLADYAADGYRIVTF